MNPIFFLLFCALHVNPERPFTCPEKIPSPYTNDARAKHGTLIVVYKSKFRLGLYEDGRLMIIAGQSACFPIAMGNSPEDRKISQDWSSTPEGWYRVGEKRDVGQTSFYRAFHIDYPNQDDIEKAYAKKIIDQKTRDRLLSSIRAGKVPPQDTDMGGWIMIHGMGSNPINWTLGCVALDNESIDSIFPHIWVRDRILIIPWKDH